MRVLKFVYLLLGVALLAVIVIETDLAEAGRRVMLMGWGIAIIFALYFITFLIDSLTWQIALGSVPLDARWLFRMWKVRLVGEAFNMTVPAGGMGGEPVKAVLLKKHYGIGYRHAAASIILAKTVNMIALVPFLVAGFVLILNHAAMTAPYLLVGGLGLVAFTAATLIFFAIQRFRLSSLLTVRLGRWHLAGRLAGGLAHIRDVESQFVSFYGRRRRRFAVALLLALSAWMVGVLEIYYALTFLGRPISFAEAWMVEAMAQMVRAGSFFIPASIGAQDGAFVLMSGAITGAPALGVGVALLRRLREIVWIAAGFALGSLFPSPGGDATGPAPGTAEAAGDG